MIEYSFIALVHGGQATLELTGQRRCELLRRQGHEFLSSLVCFFVEVLALAVDQFIAGINLAFMH